MAQPQKPGASNRRDPKTTLSMLKWTTTLSAVSLTLAGWGLLARAETVNAGSIANSGQSAPATLTFGAAAAAKLSAFTAPAQAPVQAAPTGSVTVAPTATPAEARAEAPTAAPTPSPTDTPAAKFKLDVVQWVQDRAGNTIAVVRDNQGILWYVWGDDVPRIEQGLSPQYQPVPVNQFGRSRHS